MENLVIYILFDRQTAAMGKGKSCFFYYGKCPFPYQMADENVKKKLPFDEEKLFSYELLLLSNLVDANVKKKCHLMRKSFNIHSTGLD